MLPSGFHIPETISFAEAVATALAGGRSCLQATSITEAAHCGAELLRVICGCDQVLLRLRAVEPLIVSAPEATGFTSDRLMAELLSSPASPRAHWFDLSALTPLASELMPHPLAAAKVSLVDGERLLGAALLCWHAAPPDLSLTWLALLADLTAFSLGRALDMVQRLREQQQIEAILSVRNEQWSALYNMGVALTSRAASENLLEDIVRSSVDLLNSIGGVLALVDEANGDLVVAVAYQREGASWNVVGRRLAPGEGVNGTVLISRQPVVVANYAEWPGRLPDLAVHALAIIAVPLLVQDRILGVLTLSDQAGRRQFTEDDVQTLTLFAQQAATVLAEQSRRRQAEALILYEERVRLAHDLHAGLAQDLASLLMRAELCQSLAEAGAGEELWANLETISVGLQQAIREARETIFALQVPDASGCSLNESLHRVAAAFEAQSRIPVRVEAIGEDCRPLPVSHHMALVDTVREALRNVQKHAQAQTVTLQLAWEGDAFVRVRVSDDGIGFNAETLVRPAARGDMSFGLITCRERLAMLGGSLRVNSVPGKGTTVEASIPVREQC